MPQWLLYQTLRTFLFEAGRANRNEAVHAAISHHRMAEGDNGLVRVGYHSLQERQPQSENDGSSLDDWSHTLANDDEDAV